VTAAFTGLLCGFAGFACVSGVATGLLAWHLRHATATGAWARWGVAGALVASALSPAPLTTLAASLALAAAARRLRVAGLTGGIASGKSRVSRALRAAAPGLVVVDLDELAREVVAPGAAAYRDIVRAFGERVVDAASPDRALDRAALRALIAESRTARIQLNGITHPRIFRLMMWRVARARWLEGRDVVVEAPLLFESGLLLPLLCSPIVVVAADEAAQTRRLVRRADGAAGGEAQARAMIAAQLPLPLKVEVADLVFDNSLDCAGAADEAQFERRVRVLLGRMRASVDGPNDDEHRRV